MKIRIISLMIALLVLGPATYAASSDSDVESIFLNAADDSSNSEGMPIELDDVDMPKVVKKSIPGSSSLASPTQNITAQLDPKSGGKEENIGELRKQNKDMQDHLNQLNQQMAMLRQAIEESNKMFVASIAAQNAAVKLNVQPKTQLQPASLIVEPTPSLVSALQTHPKITGTKAPNPPPAIKEVTDPAAQQQLSLNENSVVNGQKDTDEPISKAEPKPPADNTSAENAPDESQSAPHILSMGDLLKDTHISDKLAADPSASGRSLLTSEQFDQESASLIMAGKKIVRHLTKISLRYLPDDPNVMLKLGAGVFAMLFAGLILMAWPTRKKMQLKEQKKFRKLQKKQQKAQRLQDKQQQVEQRRLELQQQQELRRLELQQQKEQRELQLQQEKEQREQKRLEVQMQKETELQRFQLEKLEQQRQKEERAMQLQLEKELQRQQVMAQMEQARLAKLTEQEQLRERTLKREPEISRSLMPVVETPRSLGNAPQFTAANSIKPESGMTALYNIAGDGRESIPVKLNIARNCLENNDYEGVKQALRPVLIKGNKLQREEARIILEEAMLVMEQDG